MKLLTQSNIDPGNCWQTAIACLLDVEADELPPQCEIEAWPYEVLRGWGNYMNVLNGYLTKHHAAFYCEYPTWQAEALEVRRRYPHILIGPTIRTPALYEKRNVHVNHCVVGVSDSAWWDVHPSRAGLTEVERFGVLHQTNTYRIRIDQERMLAKQGETEADICYRQVFRCLCPKCNLDWAREKAKNVPAKDAE